MEFKEWRVTNYLNDEYYHRQDMYWYAEQAWKASRAALEAELAGCKAKLAQALKGEQSSADAP